MKTKCRVGVLLLMLCFCGGCVTGSRFLGLEIRNVGSYDVDEVKVRLGGYDARIGVLAAQTTAIYDNLPVEVPDAALVSWEAEGKAFRKVVELPVEDRRPVRMIRMTLDPAANVVKVQLKSEEEIDAELAELGYRP